MSSNATPDVQALLAAWRERAADRLDPVRFRFIEALARRSAAHNGDVRTHLDNKLSKLLEAYGVDVESAESKANANAGVATPNEPPARPLAELMAYISGQASANESTPIPGDTALRQSSYPELPVIDYFRETWSKVSTNRQLRQSQEDVPENAGPLNSSHLAHRSLSLMRELSPGYLRQFLSYVDALSWMEQMNSVGVATTKEAPRAGSAKKTVRSKPR